MKHPLLARLRTETRPQHEAIERNPYALAILNYSIGIRQYVRYLQNLNSFLTPLEAQLRTHAPAFGLANFLEPRLKVDALSRDLRQLRAEPLPVAPPEALPTVSEKSAWFGCLYVLEGSTLGGQIVAHHLRASLGEALSVGYFESYGAQVGQRWREFRDHLVTDIEPAEYDETVRAANTTFEKLNEWLSR